MDFKAEIANHITERKRIDILKFQTFEHYSNIFSVRHDLIHAAICRDRKVPFGEKSLESIITEHKIHFENLEFYDMIKKQTPDVMVITGSTVFILELTVTVAEWADAKKYSKYSLLVHFFKKNGFSVDMEVIVINPDRVNLNRDRLMRLNKLKGETIDLIKKYCDTTKSLIREIKNTSKGKIWALQFTHVSEKKIDLNYTMEDVIKESQSDNNPNKITHREKDLIDLLTPKDQGLFTPQDDQFIDNLLPLVDKITPSLTTKQEFDEEKFILEINKLSSEEQDIHSIFPLPFFKLKNQDATERTTWDDYQKVNLIAYQMQVSQDPLLSSIGSAYLESFSKTRDNENWFALRIRLSEHSKSNMALDGPGRKKYVNDGSMPHIKKQAEKHMLSYKFDTNVSFIRADSFHLSDTKRSRISKDFLKDVEFISSLKGRGLDYVKLCQSIYREININSLRVERRHKYILKPTGVDGVFILLFPGPKLRVGEMPSQIWFKLLILTEVIDFNDPLYDSKCFKRLSNYGSIYSSGWLSTDAHRLDHYLRAHDKIIMAYATILQQRYKVDPKQYDIINGLEEDYTNSLGLIIMTYMEDKRSTSKILQTARYLFMTSISVYPFYNDVMKKAIEPVRSCLQLYYLKKMIHYMRKIKIIKFNEAFSYGTVLYDKSNQVLNDKYGGSKLILPRLFTETNDGKDSSEFSEILSEMYFCMLFNKNQDDPTHASMQILTKMLEGESNLHKTKEDDFHLGYHPQMTHDQFAQEIILKPRLNQFSSRAIEIGSVLQQRNYGSSSGADHIIAALRSNMNKTIDEFATYKSSANIDNMNYDATTKRQNSRRRCLEGCVAINKRGLINSYQVAEEEKTRQEGTIFQVFKKNQIGGVREILILTMERRIIINILETFTRNLCRRDPREMLTHGSTKTDHLKTILFESRKLPGKRALVFLNFDKSKWGPTFNPCQFLYMFTRFSANFPNLYWLIAFVLIQHSNKKCLLPEKLIKVWSKDPDNLLQHRFDDYLQKAKEHFLETKENYFMNESNMGQGILHYTSSYLHLCMISFRDELYKRKLQKLKIWDDDDHHDLVSSDDSFTVLSYKISNMPLFRIKLNIFLRCSEVAERLFNCRTSLAKSSISALVGEFNSLFFSNLNFNPTTIKFTVASVHPPSTDSFFKMVKESYISSRQIVENGGSLELYYLSQLLNKKYAESIYHTSSGDRNDLSKFNLRPEYCPYQIGFYPVFHPALMVAFGPEYHNYQLSKKFLEMSKEERMMYISSHKMVRNELLEMGAEIETGDTSLGGLMRIEASMGPIRQLERIKKTMPIEKEIIQEYLKQNPLFVFERPDDQEKTLIKIVMKLYQKGAKEALKDIAASIYFGRMSATISANAFHVSGEYKTTTYSDCIKRMIEIGENTKIDLEKNIKFIYPKWKEYESITESKISLGQGSLRNPFEVMSPKVLFIHQMKTKLHYGISEILNYIWKHKSPDDLNEPRMLRDWSILQMYYPILKNTMEETLDEFSGDEEDRRQGLFFLLLKLQSIKDHTIKAIIHGESTEDIGKSVKELLENNLKSGMSFEVNNPTMYRQLYYHEEDVIFCAHNIAILSIYNKVNNPNLFDDVEDVDSVFLNPAIPPSYKKRLLMVLCAYGKISNLEEWSERVGQPLHYWEKAQILTEKSWQGPFNLVVYMGSFRMRLEFNGEYIFVQCNTICTDAIIYKLFEHASNVLDSTMDDLFSKIPEGQWALIPQQRIITRTISTMQNRHISITDKGTFDPPLNFSITVDDAFTSLYDDSNRRIMRVKTGLLPINREVNIHYNDFKHCGLRVSGLIELRAFSENFDILYKSRDETLKALDDIDLEQPSISNITQKRLMLDESKIYDADEIHKEMIREKEVIEHKELDFNFISEFMAQDLTNFPMELLEESKEPLNMELLMVDFTSGDLLGSLTSTEIMVSTRIIWIRLGWLKYQIIAHQMLNNMRINQLTLTVISTAYSDKRMFYAVLKQYDIQVTLSGHESPEGVLLNISPDFLAKFSIKTRKIVMH